MNKMHRIYNTSGEIPTSFVYSSMIPYHHITYTMSMRLPSKIKGRLLLSNVIGYTSKLK